MTANHVIPAQAGTHEHPVMEIRRGLCSWAPAFAGVTVAA
jgi:hypothetical protein